MTDNEVWYVHAVEYYSATKRNTRHTTDELGTITLSEKEPKSIGCLAWASVCTDKPADSAGCGCGGGGGAGRGLSMDPRGFSGG